MIDGWEFLLDGPFGSKAERFVRAMRGAMPAGVLVSASYTGKRRRLMLYGAGSPTRLPVVRQHVNRGGRVAMWDLGYWDRQRAMRLAVDTLHPTPEQLAASPATGRREFDLREDADPAGPIMIVGLGMKSLYAYGIGEPLRWERSKLKSLQARFPGRTIVFRPKGEKVRILGNVPLRHGMPIEEALRGLSLVVCRHSNVAVDAAIAGIPVECDDGAAAALYRDNAQPTREQRADFLARLSWWNWGAHEAAEAWAWAERMTDG